MDTDEISKLWNFEQKCLCSSHNIGISSQFDFTSKFLRDVIVYFENSSMMAIDCVPM